MVTERADALRRPVIWVLLAGLLTLPVIPTPSLDGFPRSAALMDLAHVPLGAALMLAIRHLLTLPAVASTWRTPLALLSTLVLCLGIEGLQSLLGSGQASLGDLAFGLLGAGGTLALSIRRKHRGIHSHVLGATALLLISAWPTIYTVNVFLSESARAERFPLLAGFESAGELLPWMTSGGCHCERTSQHAFSGRWALACSFEAEDRPALIFSAPPPNWRGYRTLAWEIFVPDHQPLTLFVKISDKRSFKDPSERFVQRFELSPGENSFRLPLAELRVRGGHRLLDLSRIKTVVFFLKNPQNSHTLYLDALRLEGAGSEGSHESKSTGVSPILNQSPLGPASSGLCWGRCALGAPLRIHEVRCG